MAIWIKALWMAIEYAFEVGLFQGWAIALFFIFLLFLKSDRSLIAPFKEQI